MQDNDVAFVIYIMDGLYCERRDDILHFCALRSTYRLSIGCDVVVLVLLNHIVIVCDKFGRKKERLDVLCECIRERRTGFK
jgi:hypothetical protein